MKSRHDGVATFYEVRGSGPAVLLLHGFPDSGRLWRNQVPALNDAGFRTVVPDLRGYGRSDKPASVSAYRLSAVVGDLTALLDDLGLERVHVVGHDWGAALSWVLATFVPERVDRLTVLSVGHPTTFRGDDYRQLAQSWYMLLFQFPDVAERWLRERDWENLRRWSRHPDVDAVIEELEANGSLTPALNWYRANVPPESYLASATVFPPVSAPTMGLWSTGDFALSEGQMTRSASQVSGPWRYERVEGCGHWMALEAPDVVNALLIDFLSS